jgi:hypothetical protein
MYLFIRFGSQNNNTKTGVAHFSDRASAYSLFEGISASPERAAGG